MNSINFRLPTWISQLQSQELLWSSHFPLSLLYTSYSGQHKHTWGRNVLSLGLPSKRTLSKSWHGKTGRTQSHKYSWIHLAHFTSVYWSSIKQWHPLVKFDTTQLCTWWILTVKEQTDLVSLSLAFKDLWVNNHKT